MMSKRQRTLLKMILKTPQDDYKINVEKSYNTINWNILSTLINLSFPLICISLVKSCISSARFSFLINGQPTTWISPSKGIRQENALLLYLFILITKNVTTILNKALDLGLVQGFATRLASNFNHLIYVDDLLLIIKAARLSA